MPDPVARSIGVAPLLTLGRSRFARSIAPAWRSAWERAVHDSEAMTHHFGKCSRGLLLGVKSARLLQLVLQQLLLDDSKGGMKDRVREGDRW